jgi:hypothetical protein
VEEEDIIELINRLVNDRCRREDGKFLDKSEKEHISDIVSHLLKSNFNFPFILNDSKYVLFADHERG